MRGLFNMPTITYRKSGREIKDAIRKRKQALQERLDGRNQVLDGFMKNPAKVRSYLVRSSNRNYDMHTGAAVVLRSRDEISSEELEDITQLCQRVLEIERELDHLTMAESHLRDEEIFELSLEDLFGYGFDSVNR